VSILLGSAAWRFAGDNLTKRALSCIFYSRNDWADDEDFDDTSVVLPPQQVITNKDGTRTVISYRFNDEGKKVKTTRRIRTTTIREHVNPRVAERKAWAKFGLERGKPAGPSLDTTSVGENIAFRPSINWKTNQKDGDKADKSGLKKELENKKVRCRICSGEHFTARCPFKDTMAPMEEAGAGGAVDADADGSGGAGAGGAADAAGGLGDGKSSYVPPHLRKGGTGSGGERMGGKYERDDLATLRVTNVSSPPLRHKSTPLSACIFFWERGGSEEVLCILKERLGQRVCRGRGSSGHV
jgi:translation initiation factor 3 subunit G